MPDIHPAFRAQLDRELSTAITALLHQAAQYDGLDVIEANVELTNWLVARVPPAALAAAAAGLTLRLHRMPVGSDRA